MKRIGDVLSAIFDENMVKKAKGYSVFFSCWKDLTEKNGIASAADHSWIKSLERGLVWIEVDHPGWKQILQTKESKLLSDFRYRFPEMNISGLSIMLYRPGASDQHQEDPFNESIAETTAPQNSPPPEISKTLPAVKGYDAIQDESLKKVLMGLEKSIIEKETNSGK